MLHPLPLLRLFVTQLFRLPKQRDVMVTHRQSETKAIFYVKLEQEAIEGTRARETPARQRRPTTLHEAQGSNPPIRALYMQLAKVPPARRCKVYTPQYPLWNLVPG